MKKGENLVSLAKKRKQNVGPESKAQFRTEYYLSEERRRKYTRKTEVKFIKALKHLNLKNINLKEILTAGFEYIHESLKFIKDEFKDMFAELVIKFSNRDKKPLAFGTLFILTLFISYSVLGNVFPMDTEETGEGKWIVDQNELSGRVDYNRPIGYLLEAIMDNPENLLVASEVTNMNANTYDISADTSSDLYETNSSTTDDNMSESVDPENTTLESTTLEKTTPENLAPENIAPLEPVKLKNPAYACVIKINGKVAVSLNTKEEAQKILSTIQAPYLKKSSAKFSVLGFGEKVELVDMEVEKSSIVSSETAMNRIMFGGKDIKVHEVENGESIWLIARKYNLRVKDLAAANPGLDLEMIHIGEKLNLVSIKPLISVKTQERVVVTENIPYKQIVEKSSAMYADQSRVKVRGIVGKRVISADVVKVNGMTVSRDILSEKILNKPKIEYIVKGTKPLPPKIGSLVFNFPTRGALTSRYGYRWGRLHTGIDIDGNTGTSIRSADGGRVVFAGWGGALGWLIKIDHGRGYQTWYGHLSHISVSVGEKVYKGEVVGRMGNTGRSTGSHLHFQININGNPVNPLRYLR